MKITIRNFNNDIITHVTNVIDPERELESLKKSYPDAARWEEYQQPDDEKKAELKRKQHTLIRARASSQIKDLTGLKDGSLAIFDYLPISPGNQDQRLKKAQTIRAYARLRLDEELSEDYDPFSDEDWPE